MPYQAVLWLCCFLASGMLLLPAIETTGETEADTTSADDLRDPRLASWTLRSASHAGGPGDRLRAAAIQSDGTIVLAGIISEGPLLAKTNRLADGNGVVLRLSPDGRQLLSASRIGDDVRDLAVDNDDHLVIALGQGGVQRLDPEASQVLWHYEEEGLWARVATAQDGTVVALRYDRDEVSTPRAGTMAVFTPAGEKLSRFRGHRHTLDVAICSDSQTIVHVGWRQARSWQPDGNQRTLPVQIAYMRGVAFDGSVRYTTYDWSTTRGDADFLNAVDNNMADTRGYRVIRGRDNQIYAGFEAAGGNHIFRYEPRLVDEQWTSALDRRPRGDQYFEWHNSRSEHKLFVGRYGAEDGAYLRGQQFAGRLGDGRGRTNAVRLNRGALAADEDGRLLAVGAAAWGLPVNGFFPNSGEDRNGAYVLLLSPAFDQRPFMTRISSGRIDGQATGADIRRVDGRSRMVVVGKHNGDQHEDGSFFPLHMALQPQGTADSAWFVVLEEL